MLAAFLVLSACIGIQPAFGALYNTPSQLPVGKAYDYIIVGAGTAGSVLGRRLSEDPTKNVLVIEAGTNPDSNINTQVPFFTNNNFHGAADWNFSAVAQPNVNGRVLTYPVGKTLGGSTSIGLLLYNRGGRHDYDRWANITGDPSWTWDNLFPYMTKIEHPSKSPDSSIAGKWVAAAHGTQGPLALSVYGETQEFPDAILMNATRELSREFRWSPDISSGNEVGLGWATTTIENGARASSWTHYLRPVVTRGNLDIVINTQVTRVLQTGTQNGQPVFQGVEYATSATSPRGRLRATREVILSAGGVLTPQILMLSGIGDNATLSSLGIPTIVNNSNVGLNLQEHPRLSAIYNLVPGTPSVDVYRENKTLGQVEYGIWQKNGTGPYTVAGPKMMGFFRNPTNVAPFNTMDPSAGPTCGHYQLAFASQFSSYVQPVPTQGGFLTIITNVVSTMSYGNITLSSSSPFDPPLINPGLFANYYDLATMREGIKAGWRLAQSKALSTGYLASPYGPLAPALQAGTDAALETYAMNYTTALFHPTGSARMASPNGTDGVLDSTLKVLGTVGLRVVDASAIPRTPSGNSMGPVYILAERAADIIKADASN